ncbi:MAG: hypothetical protein AAFR65_00345 [Pseudomonadota bacterium]
MTEKVRTLYKYKSIENIQHCVDIVKNNKLYCSPVSNLNDPKEGNFNHLIDPERDEAIRERTEAIIGEQSQFRVCALSKLASNMAMLAHYAGNHSGVIFEVKLNDSPNIFDVKYVKSTPTIDVLRGKKRDIARLLLTYKMEDWSHEQEVRIISENNFFGLPRNVESVTFGSMADENKVKPIIAACKKKNIPYRYLN